MGLESARFNPRDYPWGSNGFPYAWVFIVPGDWKYDDARSWSVSPMAPIIEWLREHLGGNWVCEINTSDGVMTPMEVHISGLHNARWFALACT